MVDKEWDSTYLANTNSGLISLQREVKNKMKQNIGSREIITAAERKKKYPIQEVSIQEVSVFSMREQE